jgi:hypothetical protein
MIAMKHLAAVAAVLTLGVGAANAASLLQISGGSAIVTPTSNDVLGSGQSLLNDAVVSATQTGIKLEFYFWGYEAGWTDTLLTDFGDDANNSHTPQASGSVPFPGFATPLFGGIQSTTDIKLAFNVNSGALILSQGDDTYTAHIALAYLNEDGTISDTATNMVVFALDDGGAGPDDNHDDYVGYIKASAVPLPAAAWLFGSTLFGVGGIGYGRSRRKA